MWASSCSEGVSKGCAYLLLTGTGVISMLGWDLGDISQ
jgi:hypothetical protein